MNDQEREKIDALIGGFLDGELSQRQRTELKRLVQHDPAVKKHLHALYRQKELLSSLPSEKAPRGLSESVRSALERRMILDSESAAEVRPLGRAHLFVRRIAAAAAMLFIPLGILAILVFQIMKPAEESFLSGGPSADLNPSGELAHLERGPAIAESESAVSSALGRLILVTDQPIEVNDAIKRAVVENALLSGASSQRSESGAVYRIQSTQSQMLAFSREIGRIWPNCSVRRLAVSSGDPVVSKDVVIEGIRPEQLTALIRETSPLRLQLIASSMERQNQIDRADSLRRIGPAGGEAELPVLQPVEPKIAWDRQQTEPSHPGVEADFAASAEEPQIVLIIEVQARMGDKQSP